MLARVIRRRGSELLSSRRYVLAPISSGRNAQTAPKGAPKSLDVAEPASGCDDFRRVALLELTARRVDFHLLDPRMRRNADLVAEQAGEVTGAHACPQGQVAHLVAFGGIGGHPPLNVLQHRATHRGGLGRAAVLQLAP